MKRGFGAVCKVIGLLGILAVLLLYLPLTAPRLFGLQIFAITSGSMEPEIPTGSIVYAKTAEPETLEPGDVIVFLSGEGAVTHRVVSNHPAERNLSTQGDANQTQDFLPVEYSRVVGLVKGHLPLLGQAAMSFETFQGKVLSVATLAAAAVVYALGGALRKKEEDAPAVEGE